MNNKFIPIISVFMTISLVIFVFLQFYWLKEYGRALEQEFSNKVYEAMETTREKANSLEVDKYYGEYKNFQNTIKKTAKDPVQYYIQAVNDSANKKQISYSKNIIKTHNFPISENGDSLNLVKYYTDEGVYNIKKSTTPHALTKDINETLSDGTFSLREFAKLNANNLPIQKRISLKSLDSLIRKELLSHGITTSFRFAVLNKEDKPTSLQQKDFAQLKDKIHYEHDLFVDDKYRTLFTLSLVFQSKEYFLAKSNMPMLLGTLFSLLIILGIYIICISYMSKQKKISEIKTDFINNMSHEFKTPLATISVATDSLSNDKIATNPDKVKYYSSLIKQENLRMKKQVENVLNMSKIERNELPIYPKPTNVNALLQNRIQTFRINIEKRDGTLQENYLAEKNIANIDEFHLSGAIINLLDNANKYCEKTPHIQVTTRNEENWFLIEIKDNGIGMEKENKTKVFEKFFREETGNIHNVKGQGLGLSYVKKVIELHKGQIFVESEKNQGSCFTIKLPLTK